MVVWHDVTTSGVVKVRGLVVVEIVGEQGMRLRR